MNREYSDYTYMWWKDGFNKGDREMLFQTGSYGLSVQTVTGGINRLGAIKNPRPPKRSWKRTTPPFYPCLSAQANFPYA